MFEDAEDDLKRIVALAEKCPTALQEKCFEILLTAYVNSKTTPPPAPPPAGTQPPPPPPPPGSDSNLTGMQVPEAIRVRFGTVAARLKVTQPQLASLFDFQNDPFTYHAVAVPGSGKPQTMRNVGLLVAAKTYLATGNWTADWKEFRAMCIDQGCWDKGNYPTYLNSKEGYFRVASASEGITLSSDGIRAAETLLATLANPTAAKTDDSSK